MTAQWVPTRRAKLRAVLARPASGETIPRSSVSFWSMNHWVSIGIAVMWSTGTWKKPWTWPACRSMVRTRSTPTPSRHLATMRAVIGSRGADFFFLRGGAGPGVPGGGRLVALGGVAVPGHDGDDPVRRGALGGVDHRQQLDQRVVRGHVVRLVGAGRLHDEDVGPADRLLVAAVDLAVGEGLQGHLTEVDVELAGDFGGQVHRAAATEDHHPLRVVVRDRAGHLWTLFHRAHRF